MEILEGMRQVDGVNAQVYLIIEENELTVIEKTSGLIRR
jgi:hypothetical protein